MALSVDEIKMYFALGNTKALKTIVVTFENCYGRHSMIYCIMLWYDK